MFKSNQQDLIKKLYDSLDINFAMSETETLYKLEYGQTFKNYKDSSEYVYNLLKREGFDAELMTFPADGKTTYQDKRMPMAWDATLGRLTVLSSPLPFSDPVIADYEKMPFSLVKHSVSTPKGGIRTRILTEEQVWAGEDATGCLVLLDPEARIFNIGKYLDLGAIGIVGDYLSGGVDYPDERQWINACSDDSGHWHVQSEDRDFIGFSITPRTGKLLRSAANLGAVEVLVESDGKRYEGEINAVTATLPGKTSRELWLLAHLYEPTASDNSMGVIGAITLLKNIRKMIELGEIPMPDFTIRAVFALEHYGFSAVYERLGKEITSNVIGGINLDGLPESNKEKIKVALPPYSSPFFANYLFKSAARTYYEVFGEKEIFSKWYVGFDDDTFLGDSTTGVPTVWVMYDAERAKACWHSSVATMEFLSQGRYHRLLAFFNLVLINCLTAKENVSDFLQEALIDVDAKLNKELSIDPTPCRMAFFAKGEAALIRDFKKVSDSPEIEKTAESIENKFSGEYTDTLSIWQNYAKGITVTRIDKGFPFDMIKAPKEKRKPLPDGVLYGPMGLILSAIDGKRDLEVIIREALWETDRPISDLEFKKYVNGIFYLAEYGYVKVINKNELTKEDVISALKSLGITKNDTLLVHSALSGCGHVTGGENAIIDAFVECADTVLMPSFTRPYIAFEGSVNKRKNFRPFSTYDCENISTGALPKAMLKRTDALRSAHSTHSWCGIGSKAEFCLKEHGLIDPPASENSPLAKALELNGKAVFYGSVLNGATFLHYLEHKSDSAFLGNAVVKILNPDGRLSTEVIHKHLPGCRDFYFGNGLNSKFFVRAQERGLKINSVSLGTGKIYSIDLKDFYEIGMELFKEDPNVTLCDSPTCRFCRKFDKK